MNTETKLPEDFKAKWIAALRSGEYKQGKCSLYDPMTDSYCCHGVAGYLYGISKEALAGKPYIGDDSTKELAPPDGYPSVLISMTNKSVGETVYYLAGMNDSERSFSEIADYIEKNL